MNISSTGENLNILISCDYSVANNWMAFLCWYSLTKNLPDAKVAIACNRTMMSNGLFTWVKKCNIPFELHKCMDFQAQIDLVLQKEIFTAPLLVLKPDTVVIRDFEESGFDANSLQDKIALASDYPDLCCEAKEDKPCVFATYSNGWGKFVTSSWIHKISCPFTSENRYVDGNMTANEMRIGRLWSAVTPLFQTVSRG
jgi:hypothetical protein